MKKLALIALVSLLSGCTVFDAYFMAGFDNQEYALINKIRTTAQLSQEYCDHAPTIKAKYIELKELNTEFTNYTQHIPRNPEANKMAKQMGELIMQGGQAYGSNSSVIFCKMKLQQIERNADKIQQVLGSKPR
jgi:hypothetical protein